MDLLINLELPMENRTDIKQWLQFRTNQIEENLHLREEYLIYCVFNIRLKVVTNLFVIINL
jgi:hypothetical protein